MKENNLPELPLSDDEIVKVLHSLGVDTYPSIYGFDALQVSATSVPTIRRIVEGCISAIAADRAKRVQGVSDEEANARFIEVMKQVDRHFESLDRIATEVEVGAYMYRALLADASLHVANAPQVPDNLRNEVEKLTHWKHCMSYNDSYFGEPAGDLKRIVYQLERLIAAPQPEQKEG